MKKVTTYRRYEIYTDSIGRYLIDGLTGDYRTEYEARQAIDEWLREDWR